MKKLLLLATFAAISIAATAQQQPQQPQEPTTFQKHDTVKVVLHTYSDSATLETKMVKAYKVLEIRKGDQSGQYYAMPKKYLDTQKKDFKIEGLAVWGETIFPWKDPGKTELKKKE